MVFFNSTWECIPRLSFWLTENRLAIPTDKLTSSNYLRQGVNYSLILNSAVLVEGYVDGIFRNAKTLGLTDPEDIKKEFKKVSKMTWSKYLAEFPNIFGTDLETIANNVDAELYEDITMLFRFRNKIAHGEGITIRLEFNEDEHSTELPKTHFEQSFRDILDYFVRRGLSDGNVKKGSRFIDIFFTNAIADFFNERSKLMVYKLSDDLSKQITHNFQKNHLNFLYNW